MSEEEKRRCYKFLWQRDSKSCTQVFLVEELVTVMKVEVDGAQALITQSHYFYSEIMGIIWRVILVTLKVN